MHGRLLAEKQRSEVEEVLSYKFNGSHNGDRDASGREEEALASTHVS